MILTNKKIFYIILDILENKKDKNIQLIYSYKFSQADINYHDSSIMSLLHWTAIYGNIDIFNFLMNQGYNINKRDITHPVLFYLIDYLHYDMFKIVLELYKHKININNKNSFGDSLFEYCASKKRGLFFIKEILKIFPYYDINICNEQNSNSLLIASRNKINSNILFLIQNGGNPFLKNDKEECAWDFLSQEYKQIYFETCSINEKNKVNINFKDIKKEEQIEKKRI